MANAEIVKLCLTFTGVALSIAALFVASRVAKHARRAESAYARVRSGVTARTWGADHA